MIKQFQKLKQSPMFLYMVYSVLVTVIDTSVVWILYRILSVNLVTANTVGVIAGFIAHYLLSSKSVFHFEHGIAGFTVYLGTFLLGLVIADWLIYIGEKYLFVEFMGNISFLLSKGLSIVLPFFFLYFLRRSLFDWLKNRTAHIHQKI